MQNIKIQNKNANIWIGYCNDRSNITNAKTSV